jgi:hypothetical protein
MNLVRMRVALNQQRALEEAQGTVRWLRPEFQNPLKPTSESLSKTELLTHIPRGLQADLALKLAEIVRYEAAKASVVPLTPTQIEARFKGKGG